MSNYTYQQLKDLWNSVGGNPTYADMAAAVALAESGGNPDSINTANSNGTIDRGLWQINSIHGAQSTIDPIANAKAAVAISANGTNWRPWCTAWSTGRCSGVFMGSGAPVFKYLPSGATNTGTTPTGGNMNALVSNPPIPNPFGAMASFFAQLFSGDFSPGQSLQDLLNSFFTGAFKAVGWSVAVITGGAMMFVGMWLIIVSSRPVRSVGGALAERYVGPGAGDIIVQPAQPAPAAPAQPAQSAPAAIEAQPIFPPMDTDRKRRLAVSEDQMREGLRTPPRRRPRRVTPQYQGRHRGEA